MKKRLLTFAILALSFCITSTNIYAQDDSGGAAGSGTTIVGGGTTVAGSTTQPSGIYFTRNNGDGTCGERAQIRLYYTVAPTVAPVLTQIYYDGQPLYTNLLPVTGNIADFASKGYVSFCLPTANIPPAIKLTLTYNPGGSSQPSASISGTD
jgi:hypothetical protein